MITTKVRDAKTLQEIEDILDNWGSNFAPNSTAAAFTRAGHFAAKQPAVATSLLKRLAGVWDRVLPDAQPQALANVLWACGKLRYSNAELWSSTLDAFMQQLQQGKSERASFDIANVAHGLANVAMANSGKVPGVDRPEVTAAMCEMVERMRVLVTAPSLDGVSPQHISNTLWACAKLRISPGDAAVDTLVRAVSRPAMLEAAVPQNVGNTLWAAGQLRQECKWQPKVDQRVWQRLLSEEQLPRIADRGQPKDLASTLLALYWLSSAAAGAGPALDRGFARQCAAELLRGKVAGQVAAWEPQQLANSMWACGMLDVYDAAFCDRAAAAAVRWLPSAVAADVQQLAWACCKLQYKHEQLMAGLLQRIKQLALKQQKQYRQQSVQRDPLGLVIGVCHAVAMLDMQQYAGDVRQLVATSTGGGAMPDKKYGTIAPLLWKVHAWLVQHQLLDGQGLAGLLTEQQLEEARAAADASSAQED
jgi:hypothetical protein